MEITIRNYPNRVFFLQKDIDAAKRALRNSDFRFLREDFEGDVTHVCVLLQNYVEAFQTMEIATQDLYNYMETVGETGFSTWDHETKTVKRPILTQEQQETKNRLSEVSWNAHKDEVELKHELLVMMYGERKAKDYDFNAWGYVRDINDEDEDGNPLE
jgi:hypothetical protein